MSTPAPSSFYQATITTGFQAVYLGPFSTAPTTDNYGNPLVTGQLYYNTTTKLLYVYSGSAWLVVAVYGTAAPTALVGLAAITSSTGTLMDAGSAPALNQGIVPTWTGAHTWSAAATFNGAASFNGAATISGPLVANNSAGFQTLSGTGTVTSGLVIVTSTAATTLTLPAATTKGQELKIKMGATNTNAIISASSNVVPLNSTTAGTAIIAASGKFAYLVADGTNWQIVAQG
jgi:hypothetical protein